ncbi:MAG: phenylalanine--tRNA ligase beta subunit-related protein [Actinomycetota bacterium]|nr:phenylalanine--tRNA ligase beta subunit-related protein [Actinomycetota bacterium]
MAKDRDLDLFLAGATVAKEVFELRNDYRTLLIAVDGIQPGIGGEVSEKLLVAAESKGRDLTFERPVEEIPHVVKWREAYMAFGAKPSRTRNSLEALIRRSTKGLPRINPLTNLYNAISILHQIPIGGEDINQYSGPPKLVRADGQELFSTVEEGKEVTDHPDPGEVIWRDDVGVTCRRWNWRQTARTQLTNTSTAALFIFDALESIGDEALQTAADDLVSKVISFGNNVKTSQRLITAKDENI